MLLEALAPNSATSHVRDSVIEAVALAKTIKAEVHVIDKVWASEKLTLWHYELQRNLMQQNVARLSEEMRRGRFVIGTPIFICQTPDKNRFIVNGRHTLTAIVETGIALPLVLIFASVPTMDAVGRIYATFDIHRVRSYAASWKAFKGEDATTLEKKSLTGIPHILADFKATAAAFALLSREDRMELLKDYIDRGVLDVLGNALDTNGTPGTHELVRCVCRSGIIAVALYTCLHQPSAAAEFWRLVVTESHAEVNHPTRTLARYLRTAKGAGSAFQQGDIDQAALAWNNAWEGKFRSYHKPSAVKNFRILGTPFHKGRPE